MKIRAFFGFAGALMLALAQGPALAQNQQQRAQEQQQREQGQQDTQGTYARMYRIDYVPGKGAEFMEAFDAHVQWRRDNGETWDWMTFRPVTGDQLNSIYVRSGEHTLAEMDDYEQFAAKANEHWDSTVDPLVESYASWITQEDPELSSWPDDLRPNLIQAYTYRMKPGGQQQFDAALKKIHEGLVKVNWGESYSIDRVVSGSDGNEVSIVFPFESYADMAEPDKSFMAALSEAWGEKEAGKLIKQISDSYASMDEVLVRFDPEHSLIRRQ
ncbi:hypothetical protein BH24PSE2_BH24PSE2_24190 [soil metagenome]